MTITSIRVWTFEALKAVLQVVWRRWVKSQQLPRVVTTTAGRTRSRCIVQLHLTWRPHTECIHSQPQHRKAGRGKKCNKRGGRWWVAVTGACGRGGGWRGLLQGGVGYWLRTCTYMNYSFVAILLVLHHPHNVVPRKWRCEGAMHSSMRFTLLTTHRATGPLHKPPQTGFKSLLNGTHLAKEVTMEQNSWQ